MDEEHIVGTTLPHMDFGDPCGCLNGIIRGDQAEIVCNECDAVVRTLQAADLEAVLQTMAQTEVICTTTCRIAARAMRFRDSLRSRRTSAGSAARAWMQLRPCEARYDRPMAIPMDYRAIRVWHIRGGSPGNWRELQKRAAAEGAPLDALFLDQKERWVRVSDLAPDHEIYQVLASDCERCQRGFGAHCGVGEVQAWRGSEYRRAKTACGP
jgi:hypothetical protein